jgi:hypothetical protein
MLHDITTNIKYMSQRNCSCKCYIFQHKKVMSYELKKFKKFFVWMIHAAHDITTNIWMGQIVYVIITWWQRATNIWIGQMFHDINNKYIWVEELVDVYVT